MVPQHAERLLHPDSSTQARAPRAWCCGLRRYWTSPAHHQQGRHASKSLGREAWRPCQSSGSMLSPCTDMQGRCTPVADGIDQSCSGHQKQTHSVCRLSVLDNITAGIYRILHQLIMETNCVCLILTMPMVMLWALPVGPSCNELFSVIVKSAEPNKCLKIERAHHKEAGHDLVSHQARERLERLPHGAVANDDDAAACQALLKVGGVPRMQLTRMRLEDLMELLRGSRTQGRALNTLRAGNLIAGRMAHASNMSMQLLSGHTPDRRAMHTCSSCAQGLGFL